MMKATPVRLRTRHIVSLVLATAFFLPQPFFLPVFPYAFLALSAVWIVYIRKLTPLSLYVGLCLLIVTLPPVLLGERWASYLYLLSSIALVPLAAAMTRNLPREVMAAARLYLIVSLLAVLLGTVAFVAGLQTGIIFEDVTGLIRARGLNEEPNYMGFSLVVIYILVLFHDSRRAGVVSVAVIWFLAFASFSVYAIGSLFVVSIIHFLLKRNFARLAWIFVLIIPLTILSGDRIESIVQGVDNSANFRTWGAVLVANEVVLERCGLTGCGIGSMRSVLFGDPLMEQFSGTDLLPNLIAAAWLELGPAGVIVIFGLIFIAAFGSPFRRSGNRGFSVAAFYCLLSYALSGSYLYDPLFWTTVGLFTAVRLSWEPKISQLATLPSACAPTVLHHRCAQDRMRIGLQAD